MKANWLAAGFAILATPALSDVWTVDTANSTFGFASIKNGDLAEVHEFGALDGEVSERGAAEIRVQLASVDTRIDIRNERMRDLLFNVAQFPLATIKAQVEIAGYEDLEIGARTGAEIEIDVEANGESATYYAIVNVTRIDEGAVSVSAAEPIMVDATEFGYGAGIEALRNVAGLDSISVIVPVTFDIVLERGSQT
jgi:hypothetical protein